MPQIMQPDRRQPTPAHRRNTARSGCWTLSRCPWEPPCRPASRRRPWSAVLVWKASWTHAAQGSRSPFSSGLARRAPGRSRLGDGHRRRGRGTAVVLSPAPYEAAEPERNHRSEDHGRPTKPLELLARHHRTFLHLRRHRSAAARGCDSIPACSDDVFQCQALTATASPGPALLTAELAAAADAPISAW
jgi:hypothetical protein